MKNSITNSTSFLLIGQPHSENFKRLKRKINNLQNELVKDKLSKDDFTEELSLSTESSTKASINSKISDITNRISAKTTNIALLSKEVTDAEKELQTKMFNVEKEMQDYIKKISSKV